MMIVPPRFCCIEAVQQRRKERETFGSPAITLPAGTPPLSPDDYCRGQAFPPSPLLSFPTLVPDVLYRGSIGNPSPSLTRRVHGRKSHDVAFEAAKNPNRDQSCRHSGHRIPRPPIPAASPPSTTSPPGSHTIHGGSVPTAA